MHPKNAVVVQLLLLLVCVCVATKDLWALPACIARFLNSTTEYAYCGSANQTSRRLYMALGAVCCGLWPGGH